MKISKKGYLANFKSRLPLVDKTGVKSFRAELGPAFLY
jgi:hypothetical protein